MKYAAVFVETRPLPNFKEIIWEKHVKFLPKDWDVLIVSSGEGYEEMKRQGIKDWIRNPYSVTLGLPADMTIGEYNYLLTSKNFWESLLDYDRVLIFQHDSEILREGIMEFVNKGYHYIGAPWTFQLHGFNGGFSLRSPAVMARICEDFEYIPPQNEDVWFCNILHENSNYGRLASRQEGKKFSVEADFALGSLALHAVDKWLMPDKCEQIRSQYLRPYTK